MTDYDIVEERTFENSTLEIPTIDHGEDEGEGLVAFQPINGADLLERVREYVGRFVCYPSTAAGQAHTLWIAHTHFMDAWFSTPRLAVLSPEPGSGKSRVLEMTALLVPRPLLSAVSSSAFIMRRIGDQENRPTVLYDEIDAIFGTKGKGNEDLRAILNAGYRRGAPIGQDRTCSWCASATRGHVLPDGCASCRYS